MIKIQDLARRKKAEHVTTAISASYDHESQSMYRQVDRELFKLTMKSDTMFDNENDPSDED